MSFARQQDTVLSAGKDERRSSAVEIHRMRTIYGQLVSVLAHAPTSTAEAGRYVCISPYPIAGLPGASAKLSSITLTIFGSTLHWFGSAPVEQFIVSGVSMMFPSGPQP